MRGTLHGQQGGEQDRQDGNRPEATRTTWIERRNAELGGGGAERGEQQRLRLKGRGVKTGDGEGRGPSASVRKSALYERVAQSRYGHSGHTAYFASLLGLYSFRPDNCLAGLGSSRGCEHTLSLNLPQKLDTAWRVDSSRIAHSVQTPTKHRPSG